MDCARDAQLAAAQSRGAVAQLEAVGVSAEEHGSNGGAEAAVAVAASGAAGHAVQVFAPSTMARPGGTYSHAAAAGGLVFVAGQLPIAPDGMKLNEAPFEEQARAVLTNVRAALEAAGSGVERLAQVRVYITDIGNWTAFDKIYATWLGDAQRPARAVVPVPLLHYGFLIEVEATAAQ
jgi:2-iminobutanoate/2-iminopropanoate deaminase